MTTKTTGKSAPSAGAKPVTAKAGPAKKAVVKASSAAAKLQQKPAAKAVVKPATKPAAKAVTAGANLAPKAAAATKEKSKKPKLVRDSFTMPEAEYQVLGDLKKACIKAGFEVKKSELLRAGVALLQKTDIAQLKIVLATLAPLKAGRPKKTKV